MKRMISALLSFAFFLGAASLLTGCGPVEGDTSSEKSPAVTIVNEMSEAKSCTLKNGGSVYHNGVEFEDAELCGTVTEKCTDIQNKYEPLDEKEKEEWSKKEKPKGAVASAELDNGVYVYMPENDNYVNICGTVYKTDGGEAKALYSYLYKYMNEHLSEVEAE